MQEMAIVLDKVCKTFKNDQVLRDVSMAFEKGKIHGIIGKNGSGKTVMLKLICGLMPITSGTITVSGKLVGKEVQIPDSIGAIIETPGFLGLQSGYRNLEYLASLRGKVGKREIENAMTLVGLDPKMKKHVSKYSLGMRQRLGLAQAIMEDPDILLLDEPMNGLDIGGIDDMRTLLAKLREQGKTILLASHVKEDIGILCDTVCEMSAGVLTEVR